MANNALVSNFHPNPFPSPLPPDSTGPSKTMRDLASRTSTSVRIECVAGIDKNWKNDETAIIQHLNLWLRRVHVLPSFEKPPSKSSLNTLTSTRSLEAKSLDKKELLGTERRWDASKSTHHLAERTEKDLSKSTPNLSVESKGLKGTRAKTNSMATLEDDGLVGSSRSTLLPSDLKSSVMRIFRPTSRQ
ncbi:hypothetical protein BC829DRAFT_272881 [Chytridium lagenaria]|nr:hypothetical protein BC829DRAFT_272881 [Chytridium lagenaria]